MNFPFILVDSDVLIYCLRTKTKTVFLDLLKELLKQNQRLGISHINIFEVLAGSLSKEFKANKAFLSRLPVVPLDGSAVEYAAEWYRLYRKKGRTLSIGDLMVAGSVRAHNSAVLTCNAKHFPMLKRKKEYILQNISVYLLS